MKRLSTVVQESFSKPEQIDMDWVNDEKPVQTKNGLSAIITKVDLSQIPNVIKGKVKIKDKLVEYEWYESGKCFLAHDQYNNPKKPDDGDTLIKIEKIDK